MSTRWSSLLSTWTVALRIAAREIARSQGRSLFVWLMIAIPVTAVCAVQVVLSSADVSGREQLDLKLAGHQAVLTRQERAVSPQFDGIGSSVDSGEEAEPAKKVPGWSAASISGRSDAVGRLLDRPVNPLTLHDVEAGPRRLSVTLAGVGADSSTPSGVVGLVSGRLPRTADEVAVSDGGKTLGLPADGALELRDPLTGRLRSVTVVGTVTVRLDQVVALVSVPRSEEASEVRFLVDGPGVDWTEAEELAKYGFAVSSRAIAESPPSRVTSAAEASRTFYAGLVTAGALAEVALIIGPAFAIGAAARRQQLALLAVNGASSAQLRSVAAGQGVLLGVTSAVSGVVLGTLLGVAVWPSLATDPTRVQGPLDVPLGSIALVLLLGIAAPVSTALIAARGLGRLDLTEAFRQASAPLRQPGRARGWLSAAVLLTGTCLVGIAPRVQAFDGALVFWLWCTGVVALIVGALLLVPLILAGFARSVRYRSVEWRLAARDASRQHRRSAATLTAVMAGGLLVTVLWTIVLSFDANEARLYRPELPLGQAAITVSDTDRSWQELASAVVTADPGLQVAHLGVISGWTRSHSSDDGGMLAALPVGCETDDVLADEPPAECRSLSTGSTLRGSAILSGPLSELTTAFDLSRAQQETLRRGGILVHVDNNATDGRWSSHRLDRGRLAFVELDDNDKARVVTLTAGTIEGEQLARAAAPTRFGALIASDRARELGWHVTNSWLQVIRTGSSIDPDTEARLSAIATRWEPSATVDVERGYRTEPQPLLWVATGIAALLAVIAAAIATILSVGELRPYRETLTAVGASPRFLVSFASIQSAGLAAVGTGVGCLVGLAVAAPLVIAVTGNRGDSLAPTLTVPWLAVALLMAGIPAIAGTVAARSRPAGQALRL